MFRLKTASISRTVLPVLFALLILLSACASDTADIVSADTGTDTAEAVTSKLDARLALDDMLPQEDYEGYEFKIYTINSGIKEYDPEAEVGEVINDSVYRRNRTVEERFNVTVTAVDSGETSLIDNTNAVQKIVMADEDAFDIAQLHSLFGANLSLEGLLVNLYDVKYLNLKQPWWFPQSVDELTFMNQMYLACNSLSSTSLSITSVSFVNLSLMEDYTLGDIYEVVNDGKWTLDVMTEMTKAVYNDLNGNGKKDIGDTFGLVTQTCREDLWTALDVPILQKEEDSLTIVAFNDKLIDVVERIYNLFFEGNSTLCMDLTDFPKNVAEIFSNGNSLFLQEYLFLAAENYFRESDFDYGIVPLPKYDETQSNYRSFAEGAYAAVPITNENRDRTGLLLEALTAEGYKQIYPAYFEVALKDKYLRDEQSTQMLDLVSDTMTVSFSFVYDNWQGFGHLFGKLFGVSSGTTDVASYYEKNLKTAQKRVDKIIESFTG